MSDAFIVGLLGSMAVTLWLILSVLEEIKEKL